MKTLLKRLLFVVLVGFLLSELWFSLKPSTPQSQFETTFSQLSCGVPEYQTLQSFFQPEDALKGDYLTLEFTQSDAQFSAFMKKLSVSPDLARTVGIKNIIVGSKINPDYPWIFSIQAAQTGTVNTVHIEGFQPYD